MLNKFNKFFKMSHYRKIRARLVFTLVFIYPHNSSLFFATPQIYVAADTNKIYSPVLL